MKPHKTLFSAGLIFSSMAINVAPVLSDDTPIVRSMSEIRYEHVVRQQWELSCAAASLATILRYQYGMPVSERTVALGLINRPEYLKNPELVRQRQGFSLLDLKRYVDRIGFQGAGYGSLSMDDLLVYAPIIVPVNLQGFPHFVVFKGSTGKEVLLADPAFGNVTMSIEKFKEGWISYQKIEKVGFIVKQEGHQMPPGNLAADVLDFALLR